MDLPFSENIQDRLSKTLLHNVALISKLGAYNFLKNIFTNYIKMNIRILFLAGLFFSQFSFLFAQQDFSWHDPLNVSGKSIVHGQAWPNLAYHRLPDDAESKVRKAVWGLSRHAAGVKLRFKTNAEEIKVRYVVSGRKEMPHMPATGVSGLDLYQKKHEQWIWVRGNYYFADTIQYTFNILTNDKGEKDYDLYLPLYNEVTFLEIGVEGNAAFSFIEKSDAELPVVVYGTSIAQGGCASRPGMAWTAILERKINKPLINLGFSGNGQLEEPLIDYMSSIESSLYILDCLPNLVRDTFSEEEVISRIIYSVKELREKRPNTPILLVEHAGYTDELINRERRESYQSRNEWSKEAYSQLILEGIEEIYYLDKETIGLSMDGTMDGTHPSDLGMDQYARGYALILEDIF